jgi:predicted HD superfamily hydrolase involved in NAD metabolism
MTFEQYEQEVKRHLTDKRFFHSQCVAAEAARLAQRYGADVEKARLAGILHDIMKDTPPEQQLKILRDSGIILTKTQSRNRKLWHALAGAAYLRGALGVSDEEIVSAVACHTSGKGDMSLLEKTLFVADYISADREYPGVEEMRRAADRSLEEAMVEGIRFTVNELMEQRLPVAAESIQAYNDAILLLETQKEQME